MPDQGSKESTPFLGPRGSGQSSSQTETLKHLVEDKHNVQVLELVSGDSKSQTNEDRVENDTKFEHKNGNELGRVGLQTHVVLQINVVGVSMLFAVSVVVFGCQGVMVSNGIGHRDRNGRVLSGLFVLLDDIIGRVVVVRVTLVGMLVNT